MVGKNTTLITAIKIVTYWCAGSLWCSLILYFVYCMKTWNILNSLYIMNAYEWKRCYEQYIGVIHMLNVNLHDLLFQRFDRVCTFTDIDLHLCRHYSKTYCKHIIFRHTVNILCMQYLVDLNFSAIKRGFDLAFKSNWIYLHIWKCTFGNVLALAERYQLPKVLKEYCKLISLKDV